MLRRSLCSGRKQSPVFVGALNNCDITAVPLKYQGVIFFLALCPFAFSRICALVRSYSFMRIQLFYLRRVLKLEFGRWDCRDAKEEVQLGYNAMKIRFYIQTV